MLTPIRIRKKPVEVAALMNDGTPDAHHSIMAMARTPDDIRPRADGRLFIHTDEGVMEAMVGDWVIRGIKGEVYPCKPDIFEASYEVLTQQMEARS